jgi:predicted secreted hydrolase
MTRLVSLPLLLTLVWGGLGASTEQTDPRSAEAGVEVTLTEPDYRLALPGYEYIFPRDHGAHPEFKLEWWYYTGTLEGESGKRFGFELTFFRTGMDRVSNNPSAWNVTELHVAHFALSELTDGRFRFFERVHRAGPDIAYARPGTLDVRNENWTASLSETDEGAEAMALRAYADGILLELELVPRKPPVIHGTGGVSQKADGEGRASHYYSMTRMEATGILSMEGVATRVRGESWMDHEFGTSQLAPDQVGWDWFSLQLDNGEELMLYRLRRADGTIDANSSGTAVDLGGEGTHLSRDQFDVVSLRDWTSGASGATYRLDWNIEVPALGAVLRVRPLMDDQELVTTRSTGIAYWEGAVEIEGTWRGQPVRGHGYVELTGYREDYRPDV